MDRTTMVRTMRFLLLVVLQVAVFNHVYFMGYAIPLFVGYAVLRFRRGASRVAVLLWAFAAGLLCDMFSNTMGMCMASLTFLAMAQPVLLELFKPRDSSEDYTPDLPTMGAALFIPYTLIGMLLLHVSYYMLEAFTVADLSLTLLGALLGSLLSTVIVFFVEVMLGGRDR